MQTRRASTNDKSSIIDLYKICFPEYEEYAEYEINQILSSEYGYVLEKEGKIISFFACTRKIASNGNKIGLIVCVMTHPNERHHRYAINMMENVLENGLYNEFDTILIQSDNWEIYKTFDLVDNSSKCICKVDKINTNKQFFNTKPSFNIINSIDSKPLDNVIGLVDNIDSITKTINFYENLGISFISNNGAYIWYKNNDIHAFNYTDLKSLYELLAFIKYEGEIILFDQKDIEQYFKKIDKISITKEFKKAKNSQEHAYKLIDYSI